MFAPTTTFVGLTLRTYTLLWLMAVGVSLCVAVYRLRGVSSAGAVADCGLGGLIGGALVARMLHVTLNWEYFRDNTSEIARLELGGMDWHGAVIGGLIGLLIVAHLRGVDSRALLDALTPALPVLTLAGWLGCTIPGGICAYGGEVDTLAHYPPLVVAELPDVYGIVVPRWNTPLFGALLAVAVGAIAALCLWRGWLVYRRFWLTLALLCAGMFAIGFVRADSVPLVAGLRADQGLDVAILIFSIFAISIQIIATQKRVH